MSFVFAKDMRSLALVLDEHSEIFTRGAQEPQEVIYSRPISPSSLFGQRLAF